MRRAELIEFHDLPWFPKVWRDMLTDYLAYISCEWGAYHPVLPKLRLALERGRSQRIVDLCSGASGPLIKLRRYLCCADGTPMPILLTDKYPNLAAFEKVSEATRGALSFEARPVDAMDVPAELEGFRTVFSAFHHFNPAQATRILADAVEKRAGIGVFEYTERNPTWILRALYSPVLFWRTAPVALRPFSALKRFWIYLLPLPVLCFAWDFLVSCLRTYTQEELKAMTEALPAAGYHWEIGSVKSFWGGRITYLIGTPGEGSSRAEPL
jgi:hypothetical protein